jgi:hypothetical protein
MVGNLVLNLDEVVNKGESACLSLPSRKPVMDSQPAVTFTRSAEWRYAIKAEDTHCMYSGLTRDGRQVLMGLYYPCVVAVFFDSDGRLMDVHRRQPSYLKPQEDLHDMYNSRITEEALAWQVELGFESAVIRVRKFFVPDNPKFAKDPFWTRDGIGIEDYSDHFADILSEPNASAEDKEDVLESLKRWDEEGLFVLWWGNNYWLNKDGEFVAS